MWSPKSAGAASSEQKLPGRRYAQIVKLKTEFYDEYKKCHAAVWPEVLKQIKDCKMVDCEWPRSCTHAASNAVSN